MSKNKIQVKICGITRVDDLKCAETQGADYFGFINVRRSPRFQDMIQIQEMLGAINNKNKAVLVLEPETTDEAYDTIVKSEINNIQLHGMDLNGFKELKNSLNEEKDSSSISKRNSIKENISPNITGNIINLITVIGLSNEHEDRSGNSLEETKKHEIISFAEISDVILFDFQIKGKSGGTGKQIPITLAIESAKIAKAANNDIKIFLAGGMDINLIKKEGKLLSQFFNVIDFNSSLEDSPGIKNKDKIKELMQLIKGFNWQ
ncbi:MAG: phosphoribosylanthranilate isomerase [Methanobacteriaceae archaeon]|nr:phosphoribosylanthranilate isomerase [Methanobacteriaceae archaeon]MDP3034523.1 phosphoribosylanthranilate isomerase [Methanobacteriaceae archaeon]MDP3485072.1 phosphoribosylanthranilate isomerase [Methanobacteriaceae archaeon]MDP3623876.1 phosphoribosylanthranilate isomerase [Methanobacteriaceae archaeon]